MSLLTGLGMGRVAGGGVSASLLKTGQTTSYVTGDDGDLEKGVAKSYTINTTGQYSGTTNITLNGKTDVHSNNTVTDDNTGLEWSRYISDSVGPSSNGTLPWTVNGDGEGIFEYAVAANAANLGGHNDWRVSNVTEIFSLVIYEPGVTSPDSTAFPSLGNIYLNSSNTYVTTTQTIKIRVNYGTALGSDKTVAYNVLLVRGGD